MSLINKVLRDLDVRHAAESERSGVTHRVKALPPIRVPPWQRLIEPTLAALIGGVLVWIVIELISTREQPVPEAPPPAVAEAPQTPQAPSAPPPVESVAAKPDTELRMETEISTAIPEAPAQPKVAARKSNDAKPVESAKPPVVAATATSPQISKQMRGGDVLNEQAEAEYLRGLSAARRGSMNEAAEAYRLAIKMQNNHVFARQALLSQLVEQRQWQAAEVLALDGVALMPQRHDWALLAARIQFERGDVALALDTMANHAQVAKQNPDYQVFYALLLQRAGRHAEAVTCYRNALSVKPNEGRWWYAMARALDADQKDVEARHAYAKAKEVGNLPPEILQQVERRLN